MGLRSRVVGAFSRPSFSYHTRVDSNTSWTDVTFHKMKVELHCLNWQIWSPMVASWCCNELSLELQRHVSVDRCFSKTSILFSSVTNEDLPGGGWSSNSIWGCRRAKSFWRRWTTCLRVVRSNYSVSTCVRNCNRLEYITPAGDSVAFPSMAGAWLGEVGSSDSPIYPGNNYFIFSKLVNSIFKQI